LILIKLWEFIVYTHELFSC